MEFKQKIIILTTDTQHHRYFVNKIIDQGYSIDTIFFEKNKMKSKGFYFSFGVKNYSNLPYNHYKTKVSQIIENTFIDISIKCYSGTIKRSLFTRILNG